MSSTTDYVEHYIACNPPLLPKGVEDVISKVRKTTEPTQLLEILYEPEVPWFKCISMAEQKQVITAMIQKAMAEIIELEASCVTPRMLENDPGNVLEWAPTPDISTVSANPRIVPWSVCDDTKALDVDLFNRWRFPAGLAGPGRGVWRDLENHPGVDLGLMLRVISRRWPIPTDFDDETQVLGHMLGCHVMMNMKGNLVYLGCPQGDCKSQIQTLKAMLKTFNSLVSNSEINSERPTESEDLMSFSDEEDVEAGGSKEELGSCQHSDTSSAVSTNKIKGQANPKFEFW